MSKNTDEQRSFLIHLKAEVRISKIFQSQLEEVTYKHATRVEVNSSY